MARLSPASVVGGLAFVAAAACGVYWGIERAQPRPPRAQAGNLMLRTPADVAAKHHRHSFTLGRPSHVRVTLTNPSRVIGTLHVGPPELAKASTFDPDPKHSREFPIPAEATSVFEWKDLAVGTRIVDVRFEVDAPVGMDVETRRDR